MRLMLIEELVARISEARTEEQLYATMRFATPRLGFDHFALAYECTPARSEGMTLLVHDYPDEWAKVYVGFDLGGDRQMLAVGRDHGIVDGYTVPRHLPGEASGSCSFATRTDSAYPKTMLHAAEVVGAFALARARCLAGPLPPGGQRPALSERQRECVLWSARGKTAGEIATILGISEETVVQHLKLARERYDVHSRQSLILCALFDGLISFADIFHWWRQN